MRPNPAVLLKILLLALALAAIWAGPARAHRSPGHAEPSRRGHASPHQKCRRAKRPARSATARCDRGRVRKPHLDAGLIGGGRPPLPSGDPGAEQLPAQPPATGAVGLGPSADAEAPAPPPAEKAPESPEEEEEEEEEEEASPTVEPAHFRFFSPTSVWNTPVPDSAPLDPQSSAMIGAFDALVLSELQAKTGPSINTTESSVPIYTVPAEQATVPIQLSSGFAATALRSAWSAVPLPPSAQPAIGNDHHLVVWQPSTDRLWEFWEMSDEPDGWHAGWGGAVLHASSNPGVYDTDAWPGATRFWGASASSLSIAAGLITFDDLEHGSIEHALSMSIPNVRAGVYSSPAQRGDGKSLDPLALPEGAHLRLDPSLELSRLHLPAPTLMLARAAQRYGIIVRDGARTVTFQAQDPTPTGSDPYRGPSGFWEGSYPRAILSSFPWQDLQLLQMDLHANPGT